MEKEWWQIRKSSLIKIAHGFLRFQKTTTYSVIYVFISVFSVICALYNTWATLVIMGFPICPYYTVRAYVLHKAGKQEYEPKGFTVYHGAFKHQYHDELVCSCVHRYGKLRGSASNRIKVFTTILTTFDRKNIRS